MIYLENMTTPSQHRDRNITTLSLFFNLITSVKHFFNCVFYKTLGVYKYIYTIDC